MAYLEHPFNTALQYGSESTYGTEVATTNAIGKVTNFTPTRNNNLLPLRNVGSGRNVTQSLWGPYDSGGTIDAQLHDFDFLKYWIGPKSGAGTSGNPYVLTESAIIGTTSSTDILPFSLEVGAEEGATDAVNTYVGCVGNTFTLNGSIGNPITGNFVFIAKTHVPSTTATAYTEPSTPPWMYQQITYKYGTGLTAIAKVQSWSITMTNNLFTYRDSSRFIEKPEPGMRDYTWTMTVLASDANKTAFEEAADGSSTGPVSGQTTAYYQESEGFQVLMQEGTNSGQRQAQIKLANCWIDNVSKPVPVGNELTLLTITGGARSALNNNFVTWWTN